MPHQPIQPTYRSYCIIGQYQVTKDYTDQPLLHSIATTLHKDDFMLRVPGSLLNWGVTSKIIYGGPFRKAVFGSGAWYNNNGTDRREIERATDIFTDDIVWVSGHHITSVDLRYPRIGGLLNGKVYACGPAVITPELLEPLVIKKLKMMTDHNFEHRIQQLIAAVRCAVYACVGDHVGLSSGRETVSTQLQAPEILVLNEPAELPKTYSDHEIKQRVDRKVMLNAAMYFGVPVLRVWEQECVWLNATTDYWKEFIGEI